MPDDRARPRVPPAHLGAGEPKAPLARAALETLRDSPPTTPLLLVQGHTHEQSLEQIENLTLLNPGSVGGGGTGKLAEADGDIGLARVTYTRLPAFQPRAADLVQIDPGDGDALARRFRLDDRAEPQPSVPG
ncbi:MAG: metallophosphoesterase family protein [Actinobacteria bacterium]|nr:metallophosphoesterase family protein [Actinomycetota bacterium]